MIDFNRFPSPCYIMEEELLRKNLSLIKSVADRAGVEIILAFKSFAMWRSFPIFREYINHSTASSVYEARLALEEFGSKAHTYSPAYTEQDFPEIMRWEMVPVEYWGGARHHLNGCNSDHGYRCTYCVSRDQRAFLRSRIHIPMNSSHAEFRNIQ